MPWGAQLSTSPDMTAANFVPAYNCTDFTKEESELTLAVRVLFTGLVTGTQYYYVTGSPLVTPWSRVYQFTYNTGALREGGPTAVVIADFGYYNAESIEKLSEDALNGRFDTILHAGDMAYDLDADAGRVGDNYMNMLEPIVSGLPYNGIPGNHEVGSNYSHYKTRFASVAENAGVNSLSGTNMHYSLDDGLVHYIFWDSEVFWSQPLDSQTTMVNWLRDDLTKANKNRASVPWIIALAHKTWYMDDTLQCPNSAGCIVWNLLTAGGVDLFFAGHIHYYARFLPEYPNAANGTGVVDKNCSSANQGNVTNPVGTYTNPLYMTTIITAAPGDQEVNAKKGAPAVAAPLNASVITVTSTNNYGYGFLTICNETTLHWRFETAVPHVNSSAPHYTDDFWLIVDNHGPRNSLPPQ
jgi:hypothetical protein